MNIRSCFFCKHGERNPGFPGTYWEPPEPSFTDCTNKEVDFNKLDEIIDIDDEEKLPEFCGHFEPRMVEKCGFCHTKLNIPEHDVIYYVEETPVCSKDCQDSGYREYDNFYREG